MKIGDLAILHFADAEAEMFHLIFTRVSAPNDVVIIEEIADKGLYGDEIVMYMSTHTGHRDWLRTEDFRRTFKIITTNEEKDE